MGDGQQAFLVSQAIVSTQNSIRDELERLAALLERYNFILDDCSVSVDVDRLMNGDTFSRFDVKIRIEVK